MATLKSLVDETTNIKNEIVECYSDLKKVLTDSDIEVLNTDKLSNLINKAKYINSVKYLYYLGDNTGNIKTHYKGSSSSSILFNTNSIQIQSAGNSTVSLQQCVIGTPSSINLSKYNKLRVTGKLNQIDGKITFGIGSDSSTATFASKFEINGDKLNSKFEFDLELDISNISSGFVKFEFRRNLASGVGVCNIYKIWLEA